MRLCKCSGNKDGEKGGLEGRFASFYTWYFRKNSQYFRKFSWYFCFSCQYFCFSCQCPGRNGVKNSRCETLLPFTRKSR